MSIQNQYLLHENASGYALFQQKEAEMIAQDTEEAQAAIADYEKFSSMVKLVGFVRFETAESALEECNAVANGEGTQLLVNFLELNLPKGAKKKASGTYSLGVLDPALAANLGGQGFSVNHGQNIKETLRGCLMHFSKMSKDIKEEDLCRARCGLAHCFSRNKMQLDPNRQDKPIMNTIAILDSLDKNINTFAMRVREWYAWHFPELSKIVADNIVYAQCAKLIRVRDDFKPEEGDNMQKLIDATGSEEIAEDIKKALKTSMGQDISEMDIANIEHFAHQVVKLATMRKMLGDYLKQKMDIVAPNLASLIGERVGARLITHAGSLVNLAKYPASTVQILGAEKALFRALKTKGNTPKYGLLFHSSFIGRAQQKNKGRISRYLANKCSIASRIDCFSDFSTQIYGEKLKDQVEDRLAFLTEGKAPKKNADVMLEALAMVTKEQADKKVAKKEAKKDKKRKLEDISASTEETPEEPAAKKSKKDKKEKKAKKEAEGAAEATVVEAKLEATSESKEEKKKKKKDKKAKKAETA